MSPSPTLRKRCIALATLTNDAGRYDDMTKYMECIVRRCTPSGEGLDDDERNLFSMAFKNLLDTKRDAWRIIQATLKDTIWLTGNNDVIVDAIDFRCRIELEIEDICDRVCELIDRHLYPTSKSNASKMFYLKMKGDYYRYVAETRTEGKGEKAKEEAEKAYRASERIKHVSATHPVKLGLALNRSVFLYDIKGKTEDAKRIAEKALDAAVKHKERNLEPQTYKDTKVLMEMLKSNISEWTKNPTEEL